MTVLTDRQPAPDITGTPGAWFHSPPVGLRDLRGRVVLLDFFDYTSLNCLRTIPHLRRWASTYSAAGLSLIGVHAPEFPFAWDQQLLGKSLKRLEIEWPVISDPDFVLSRRYSNRFWPAVFLIDARGDIRFYLVGEGRYRETEEMIQLLLSELPANRSLHFPAPEVPLRDDDEVVDPNFLPELYLGKRRGNWSGPEFELDEVNEFLLRSETRELTPSLGGPWVLREQFLESAGTKGHPSCLFVRYHAGELGLVAEPPVESVPQIDVRVDGQVPPETERGSDLSPFGSVLIDEGRLYQLVSHGKPGSHRVEISCSVSGVRLYTLAFGASSPAGSAAPKTDPASGRD